MAEQFYDREKLLQQLEMSPSPPPPVQPVKRKNGKQLISMKKKKCVLLQTRPLVSINICGKCRDGAQFDENSQVLKLNLCVPCKTRIIR
ncbi:unnamed protein product [Caenorhabditis brenneri]